MGWFSDGLKSVGVGGDVLKTAEAVDNGVRQAAKAAQDAVGAAAKVAVGTTVIKFDVAKALTDGDVKSIESKIKDLVKITADAAASAAKVASSPYFIAADISRDFDGEGAKLLRGAIAAELVQINVLPLIIQKLASTGEVKPEDALKAPIEVLLAAFLQAAHDVLEPKAEPIPKLIKKLLKGHFDDDILNSAKYITSEFGLTLPEAIGGIQAFMGNHAFAVTVGNVIVFTISPDASDAAVHWWAHEMQHVAQYQELGIDGFVRKYVSDYELLEDEADKKAAAVLSTLDE